MLLDVYFFISEEREERRTSAGSPGFSEDVAATITSARATLSSQFSLRCFHHRRQCPVESSSKPPAFLPAGMRMDAPDGMPIRIGVHGILNDTVDIIESSLGPPNAPSPIISLTLTWDLISCLQTSLWSGLRCKFSSRNTKIWTR
jgi:hypothetical protein